MLFAAADDEKENKENMGEFFKDRLTEVVKDVEKIPDETKNSVK